MSLVSNTVLARPQLLEYHIRAQWLPALHPDTRQEYAREDRQEALYLLQCLARVRHERPEITLRDLLAD